MRIAVAAAVSAIALVAPVADMPTRAIALHDLPPPFRHRIASASDPATFAAYVAEERRRNQDRVHDGDLDSLVYYALQSTRLTALPPIEPALSAKALVEGLSDPERARYLNGGDLPMSAIPPPARARLDTLARAAAKPTSDPRLAYLCDALRREPLTPQERPAFLARQYLRAMRFVYHKEFATDGSAAPGGDATPYRTRGFSTDTAVESGYGVYTALATLRDLEPQRRIQRALVVGAGLDLAPRTALQERVPPQSYQPFAVVDALLALKLADRETLRLACVDINPRVVEWLRWATRARPQLALATGVAETDRVRLTDDYRAYFSSLGSAIGEERSLRITAGRLGKSLKLDAHIAAAIDAGVIDVVTDVLESQFDLVVVTNVFPYLTDTELLLALTNIGGMLAPGGVLVHNEPRPLIAEAAAALHLPLIHSRSVVIATVEQGRSPLYDTVFMHRRPAQ